MSIAVAVLLVTLLVLGLIGGWILSLLGLFGTWVMVGLMALWTAFAPVQPPLTTEWKLVALLLFLAVLGEVLEFVAGLIGTTSVGGSKRGTLLAALGGVIGGALGLGWGTAVLPVIGSVLGALLVGGAGAMGGAVLGEYWKGRDKEEMRKIGAGAFWGRVFGTLAKTSLGTLMLVLSIAALMATSW